MKKDKINTAKMAQDIARATNGQERFSPETVKQLKDKDILEVIIKSCPAKFILNCNKEEDEFKKE